MGPFASLLLAAVLLFPAALWAAEFTTYIGDQNSYHIARLVVDPAGNTYAAGSRTFNLSLDPFRPDLAAGAFVMRLDSAGRTTAFATVSGKGNDGVRDIALDANGNVYVAGGTSSPDLPLRSAMQSKPGPGFIAKFNPDLSQLLYCSYFPAPIQALALDPAGNLYVTGTTNSRTFPVTPGLPAGGVTSGVPMVTGAFVTKISAAGDRIVYSGVFAGIEKNCGCCSSCFTSSRSTAAVDIAVDATGAAYIAGNTDTLDLPTSAGAMAPRGPGAFVAKVHPAGNIVSYLTYLGSGNLVISPNSFPATRAGGIAVDSAGNAYVVGATFDPKFPATSGAFQTTFRGPSEIEPPIPYTDAFVLKLNPVGAAVVWATYLGGASADAATSVTLDSAGSVWVGGTTSSDDFPNAQGWSQGGEFIVRMNAAGTALPYSGRYPDGAAQHLALDSAGVLHIAGDAAVVSAVTPVARPVMRPFGIANAASGALGGRIAPGEVISLFGPHIGPAPAITQPNTTGSVPRSLGGVQVFVNDIAAPLLYVSDSQINAVVPFGVTGETARIRIVFDGITSPDFVASVLTEDPQIFQTQGGFAAALNADGTVNSLRNPAKPGSAISIWVTGTQLGPDPIDGEIATGAREYQRSQVLSGTTLLFVDYVGAAPGIVAGVTQINFRLPVTFTTGPITIMSGGVISNSAIIVAAEPE